MEVGSEDRRLVTILFADVVSSSRLAAVDAERLRDQMARFFSIAREEIVRFGGTVEKFVGDAVMAIFGLPSLHEDDPIRAVLAAVAIRGRIRPEVEMGALPTIRIGISTGEVVADPARASLGEFLVTGDSVNLAARLQQLAQPGQILVGESTYSDSRWAANYQKLPPIEIKGWAHPIAVYECHGLQSQTLSRTLARGIGSPLVGRHAELTSLTELAEHLLAGRGGAVSIIGDAGLGKSRLVAELRSRYADRNLRWLEGHALSFGRTISYWPFLEIIRGAAGIAEEDGEAKSWAKLEAHVKALLSEETADVLPYLASMLALPVRGEYEQRVRFLDADAIGRQIFRASRRYFERLAQDQPLILVIEDVHWIDQSSAGLLEHLLPLVTRVPILAIVISRPESETPAAQLSNLMRRDYADRYIELILEPLSPQDAGTLVHNLLDVELPLRVRDLILQKAEGNPFFVEEMIRSLIDQKTIVRDSSSGRWQSTGELGQVAIPDTLRGVITARIDRLDEEVKQVLRAAAVIGRSFFYRVLRAIAERGEKLDQDLFELQRLEFIHEKKRLPELEYVFKHVLTQEAAYESILLRRRRELHRRVAEVVEALFADRQEEFHSLLAHHYAQAEEWEKAHQYLLRAGDHAGRIAADTEALEHYRRAMAAYSRAFGERWDPVQRAALERKVGEALFRRGEFDQTREHLRRALALLGTPIAKTPWGIRGAIASQAIRQLAHRLLPAMFRPASDEVAAAVEERARVHAMLGWMERFNDMENFALNKLILLNVAESSGMGSETVNGMMAAGVICDHLPLSGLAGYYHRQAVKLAERLQSPVAIGLAELGLGMHEGYRGRWGPALKHFEQASSASWAGGDLLGWGSAQAMIGLQHFWKGEFARGLNIFERVGRGGQDAADRQLLAWGRWGEGLYALFVGRLDEAAQHLRQAIAVAMEIPEYFTVAVGLAFLGQAHLRRGQMHEALELMEQSRREIDQRHFRGVLITNARNAIAEAYLVAAERLSQERDEMLKLAKRACRQALKDARIVAEGLPGAYRVAGMNEWLRGRRDAARRRWDRSLAVAGKLEMAYERGLTHLEVGRRTEDSRHLEHAEAIFSEIGAMLDLAQVRSLRQKEQDSRPGAQPVATRR